MMKPPDIVIRECGAAEIDDVMTIMAEAFDPAFGEAWSAAQCLAILDFPGVWISLATRDGVPAGFALNRRIIDEAELLLIGVRPEFRRRGIASALLDRSAAVAQATGATRLHLEVRQGNGALDLYRSAGFQEIGRRRGYYRGTDGRTFDAITLALSLPPQRAL